MKLTAMRTYLIAVLLAALTMTAYWQVLGHQFLNYDEDAYVTRNHIVKAGLTLRGLAWSLGIHESNWHPLTWISHMADCRMHGLDPGGHHLSSLLLHALNVVLLFLLLNRLTHAFWKSAFAAALFAVHPLHVESVAWIAERKEVLSTAFLLLTMLAYARYAERPGAVAYLSALCAFALGLMSKPMLVTLPLLLLLLDYWPLGRVRLSATGYQPSAVDARPALPSGLRGLLLEKVPFLILAVASAVITLIAQREGLSLQSFEHFPLGLRIENALVTYAAYIGRMLWPAGLSVFYPYPSVIEAWRVVGSAILLAAVTVIVAGASGRRYLLFGWLWYVITLLPVIGLVQIGWQSSADRYTYIPLIGLFTVVAWGVPDLIGSLHPSASPLVVTRHATPVTYSFGALALLSILVLSALAWRQLGYWSDSVTLFRHALRVTPDNPVAHNNLGLALADRHEYDSALEHLHKALRLQPGWADAYHSLGATLLRQGRARDAEGYLRRALEINPGFAEAHNNLGAALMSRGKFRDAMEHLNRAVRLQPDYAEAHNNLGIALAALGRPRDAIREYSTALSIDETLLNAYCNMGMELAGLGKPNEAVVWYRRALRANPGWPEAQNDLAWILATQAEPTSRNVIEAVSLAESANNATGGEVPEILDTLAAAYASAGRFEDAVKSASRALDLASSAGDADLARRLRQRIDGYARHRTLRTGA